MKSGKRKLIKRRATKRKLTKRKLFKRRGGSVVPFILQDAFWTASDSLRDTYNGFSGHYQGQDSSITSQGKL
jgi:hypothetical protein